MPETYMLGEGKAISTDSDRTQLNNNILVVGASGSGKTMSYAEMCLLKTRESSMIVTLSKRRLVYKYAPLFGSSCAVCVYRLRACYREDLRRAGCDG